WAWLFLFAPLAVLSLFVWNLGGEALPWYDPSRDHWLSHFFCMFFLGSLAWWVMDGRLPAWLFWGYSALVISRVGYDHWTAMHERHTLAKSVTEIQDAMSLARHIRWDESLELSVALVAGISIYLLGCRGKLTTALDYRVLQYLGRISYSLYL